MSKRQVLVITAGAISIAVLGSLWTLIRGEWSHPASATGPAAEALDLQPANTAAPVLDPTLAEPEELAEVAAPGERSAQQAPTPAGPDTADSVWLEGRVQYPLGTPADERVVVFATDRARKFNELVGDPDLAAMAWDPERQRTHALTAAAEVAPDGSFRLELPVGTETAHLALTGRYLFSMATMAVSLPATEGTTLTGELGAWVTGMLLPPADPSPLQSDFEWIKLELGPDITAGFDMSRIDALGVTREVEASSEGEFEFRGIPGAGGYGVAVEHGHLAALLHLGVDPKPGEHLELELQMQRGATLRGRVVEAAGEPVSGATIEVRWRGTLGSAIGTLRKTSSEADGSFELPHVALGKLELTATSEGLLAGQLKVETELSDGVTIGDLEIVLEGGEALVGWVTFPDGSPAEGVNVRAGPDLSQLAGMNAMSVVRTRGGKETTDAAGRFELAGLADALFAVRAELHREEGEHAGRWRASAENVQPGGEPVRLVLQGLVPLRGRVIDDRGEPVTAFRVRAELQGSGTMFGIGAERRSEEFEEAPEGEFSMEGFTPATWDVRVTAEGFASSEKLVATLLPAGDSPELLFTLMPAAGVAGRVLDAAGSPAAGARVTLELDLGQRMQTLMNSETHEVYTDVDGEFLLENLDPGAISLVASLEGFAASEGVPATLVSGQVTEGLVLELRTGGTLTGLVFDNAGEPAAGRMVIAQQAPNYAAQKMLSTDARGEFRIEHLEPGSWQVIATENFMDGDSELSGEDADMSRLLGSMKMGSAEIVDGEETHIVLGAPPADPVGLRGRVTHAGAPVAGTIVSLVPEDVRGVDALNTYKMAVTDAAGAFELQLDQPGSYRVTVQPGVAAGQQSSIEFLERIPEGATEHTLELELPGGRISGRVRGPDGAALDKCRVTVSVESGMVYGSLMGGNYAELQTDADGEFDAKYLRAGTYTVGAGGALFGGLLGGESAGGRSVQTGVRLADGQWLEGVDFRLEEPAELSGTVLGPGGSPISGANIYLRDEAGQLLERFSMVATDSGGRFTYSGLASGRYRVSARKGELVSEESALVTVAAGGSGEVRVNLLQGTILLIAVEDESGAELHATISVLDPEGHEVAGMLSMEDLMGSSNATFSSSEQRVGPLPDGRYKVTATHADGRTKSRSVRLSGQGERKVKLRLN